jgi:hypothetical protein
MHGLTVWQQDDAKVPAVHLIDPSPTPHPAISLDALLLGDGDNAQNPFVLDYRSGRDASESPGSTSLPSLCRDTLRCSAAQAEYRSMMKLKSAHLKSEGD